ncbi:MAG TPA: energy-coupling factor ABC transporter ATP-binding protein [Victivallales bacterium]|nr:energy-coupling factor ABC transporter ATP-binding protein [Victivallales bacterium]
MNASPIIKFDNVSFAYPDGTEALRQISLEIAAGSSTGIIGANGAGKSTLVNHLNAFHLPKSGCIVVNGHEASKKNSKKLREDVGLIFQNPDDQLFMPRLIDDVLFGPMNLGIPKKDSLLEAERVMRDLGIWELRMKPPFNLSQGQKRFASIATVLVMNPSILVMDEPTSDLDPRNRRKLINMLKRLNKTKIIVSHDLDFVWDTCERTVIMSEARIVAEGRTEDIVSQKDLLEKHGLELPIRMQKINP